MFRGVYGVIHGGEPVVIRRGETDLALLSHEAIREILGEVESLPVIPATLLREGTYMNFIPIDQINMILVIIIVIGNLAWISSQHSP